MPRNKYNFVLVRLMKNIGILSIRLLHIFTLTIIMTYRNTENSTISLHCSLACKKKQTITFNKTTIKVFYKGYYLNINNSILIKFSGMLKSKKVFLKRLQLFYFPSCTI